MIVDFHTHLFPPEVIDRREVYLQTEPVFHAMYQSPKARLATPGELLRSMDEADIEFSVALGFAWQDPETCRLHNDFLLEAAADSKGRIIPFCTLPLGAGMEAAEAEMVRCLGAGAPGFGELRPDNLGFGLAGEGGKLLGRLAAESGCLLLFHATEPVGHPYSGKEGLQLSTLYEFILEHPDARTVAAHWGGGLPFYALMPEVKLALTNVAFDTAATSLLYNPAIYGQVSDLLGAGSILFGSDFPLLSQKRSRERVEAAGLSDDDLAAILGGNAARLLGLPQRT